MLTPLGYFDLVDEMDHSGCPICNLLMRDIQKLLTTIVYEYVTEPEMHGLLRASRGLCNVHGWQLAERGNVLSIATLYSAVVDEMIKELDRSTSDSIPQKRSVRRLLGRADNRAVVETLTPKANCPVCKKNDDNQQRYVMVFGDHLSDEKLMTGFRKSDGLCLQHFQQVLDYTSDTEGSQVLIEIQRAIWIELKHDLDEFGRKYDVNNADEAMGKEGDSWLRAIRQVGGGKGVSGLRDV